LRSATSSFKRRTLSGANLAHEVPGRLRPRLETMRHWITSFQLLNRSPEYGRVRCFAQRKRPNAVRLPGDCGNRTSLCDALRPPCASVDSGRCRPEHATAAVGRTGHGADWAMPAYALPMRKQHVQSGEPEEAGEGARAPAPRALLPPGDRRPRGVAEVRVD